MNAALDNALDELTREFHTPAPQERGYDGEAAVETPENSDDGDDVADDEPPDNRRDGDVEEDLDEDCCVWDQKARDRKDKDLQWARDWA